MIFYISRLYVFASDSNQYMFDFSSFSVFLFFLLPQTSICLIIFSRFPDLLLFLLFLTSICLIFLSFSASSYSLYLKPVFVWFFQISCLPLLLSAFNQYLFGFSWFSVFLFFLLFLTSICLIFLYLLFSSFSFYLKSIFFNFFLDFLPFSSSFCF